MVGRNDPCPCGSGKKYKMCCLKKDEAARRAKEEAERAARAAAALPPPPIAPTHPERSGAQSKDQLAAAGDDAFEEGFGTAEVDELAIEFTSAEARWEEFIAERDYEGQIALFLQTLDDGLMDGENAFEMLNVIYDNSVARGERDRFEALAALLRERLPEVWAEDAHFYLEWQITNALVAGRLEQIPALADELADLAGAQLDSVNHVFDQLAYHGQLPALAAAVRRAWPLVRGSDKYDGWGIGEFAERATTCAMLDYLERTATPNAVELSALGAEFECVDVRPTASTEFLVYITGQAERRWRLEDFDLTLPRRRKGEPEPPAPGRLALYHLTVEFLGYLHRAEGVPYSKGELARDQIQRYILARDAGWLKDPSNRSKAKKAPLAAPPHPLCPDFRTLGQFLENLLNTWGPQLHKGAAMFEMIPAWLRFLEARGLLDSTQRGRTLDELADLVPYLADIWSKFSFDPALRLAAARWRETAGLI